MHVTMLKRKLENRPRKLRPVRCCFLSTFRLITCRSFISWILFIFETTGTIRTIIIWKQGFTCVKPVKYKCVNYVKLKRPWKSTSISIFLNTKLRNMQEICIERTNDDIQRRNATYLPAQSPAHKITRQKHHTNLKQLLQQSIAHEINVEILKGKYEKTLSASPATDLRTKSMIIKIYFLQQCRSKRRGQVKTDLYKMLKIRYYQATVCEVFKKPPADEVYVCL